MSEIIAKTEILKEKGFIYFLKQNEDGLLDVYRAKAGRKKKVVEEKIEENKSEETKSEQVVEESGPENNPK